MSIGSKPLWPQKIAALRARLGESQAKFARRFGLKSAMAVHHWEKGDNEPSAENYVQMARLAGDPDCWFFWEQIGLSKADVARALPELQARLHARGEPRMELVPARGAVRPGTPALKKRPDAVAIPLLKDASAAGSPRLIEEAQVERTIIADLHDCPHPEHTICIRIQGRAMYPVLDDGYIVAVDTFVSDLERLIERLVAARDPEGGITVQWLRKVSGMFLLLPQHTAPEYPPVLITEPDWKIVGEVIWWIGRPPQ